MTIPARTQKMPMKVPNSGEGRPYQSSCFAAGVPLAAQLVQIGCGGMHQTPFGLPATLSACIKTSL